MGHLTAYLDLTLNDLKRNLGSSVFQAVIYQERSRNEIMLSILGCFSAQLKADYTGPKWAMSYRNE